MHQSLTKTTPKFKSKLAESLPKFQEPKLLAQAIKQLSDIYAKGAGDLSAIWQNEKLAQAYISYFLPLNMIRLNSVFAEAKDIGFLHGLHNFVDVGSGPGTVELSAFESAIHFEHSLFIEKAKEAVFWHKKFITDGHLPAATRVWKTHFEPTFPVNSRTLITLSYAFNEMKRLPDWILKCEALLIVEPATQADGRNLQKLRQELIEKGFFAWAPCTHQEKCPLLEFSKTDWCHHRVHVELSENLREVEAHLPMKNQTLTFSYLLMRRTPPTIQNSGRVIGDTLFERGKVKQAVCRGPRREFLSWLTRNGEPEPFLRGSRVSIPREAEIKGNEIRLPNTQTAKTVKD